jgi:hypothetical protein
MKRTVPSARRLAASACVALLVSAFIVGTTAGSTSRRHPARPIPGIAVLRYGSSAELGARHLHRYAYVLLSKSEFQYGVRIKRLSPRTKVLVYDTAADLVDNCVPASSWMCPAAITYQRALAHDARHPGDPWVLRDASGKSLGSPYYHQNHLADVGSRSYQRVWVRRVVAAARRGRFDGVMIDNVTARVSDWTHGPYPTLYASNESWERAMRKFVRFVGPALKARGLYVLTNTFKGGSNDGSADVAWWKWVARYVNGLMAEYWEQRPLDLKLFDTNPCCWTGTWYPRLRLAAAAQRAGADFFPLQYGPPGDVRTMTYGKASFLLVWDGSGGGYIFQPQGAADPWNPAWTTGIGKPADKRRRIGVGWQRAYTRGIVVINPDPFREQTFRLRGRYAGAGGEVSRSVTLQPVSAMILRRVAS